MTFVQKRLVGLLVMLALGGAGVFVVYWQTKKSESEAAEKDKADKVLAFTSVDSAREVALTTPKGTFTLVRESGADGQPLWLLKEPLSTPADRTTVEGLLEYLATLKQTHAITDKPDLKLFGLAPARFVVQVKDDKGAVEKLLVGEKNSFNGALFVQKDGDAKVSVVPGSLEYQVDKDLFTLRDKRLVAFEMDDVVRLDVERQGKPAYTLAKKDGRWRLESPKEVPADDAQVQGILSGLVAVNAKAFVLEQASESDLATYGITKPRTKVTMTFAKAAPRTLLFGEKDSALHASLGVGAPVLELASDFGLQKLEVDAEELRDKHVASFDRDLVGSLTITQSDKTLTFVREDKPEGEGETWKLTAPEQAKAKDSVVAGLVYLLWNMKAKRIEVEQADAQQKSARGLDKPALTVELKKKDGSPLASFAFGNHVGEDQYVTSGTRIDLIPATDVEDIKTDVTHYKEDATAQK